MVPSALLSCSCSCRPVAATTRGLGCRIQGLLIDSGGPFCAAAAVGCVLVEGALILFLVHIRLHTTHHHIPLSYWTPPPHTHTATLSHNAYLTHFLLLCPGVKLDGQSVTLEPGGQFELSGAPLTTLHQTCAEVNSHLYQVGSRHKENNPWCAVLLCWVQGLLGFGPGWV